MVAGVAGAAGFAALTAGVLGAAAGVAAFVKEGVRMSATLEQLRVNLDVMTGSARTGEALLGSMVELAKETPFSLEDVAGAGKVLLAMGAAPGDVTRQVKMLGDVAAGTSQPVNQLAQVFGEVQQAGRLMSNELRQFNMRGIPLLTELSEMLGVTKVEVRGLVEAGEITADMVEQAFERMTSAGGRFADLMGKQAETLTGKWERFTDALSLAAAAAAGDPGTSGTLSSFLKNTLDEASKALEIVSTGAAAIQSQGTGAFTQEGKMRFELERINQQVADAIALRGAEPNPAMEVSEEELQAMESQNKLNDEMLKFKERLQLQIDTFGMSSDAAELYEMKMRGATKADIEATQALIEHHDALKKTRKDTLEATKREDENTKFWKSFWTPAEKLGEEFHDFMRRAKEADLSREFTERGLMDFEKRARELIGSGAEPVRTQSTAAIRAGTIEALQAQFAGKTPAEKTLKEQEKIRKEAETASGLLKDIRELLKSGGLGDGSAL